MEPGALGRRRRRGGAFSIARLFANGEAGGVYDPSDLTAEKVAWRRNLLTWSEDFTNAAWTKDACTITANTATAPDGTLTADKIVSNNATAQMGVGQSFTAVAREYTASWYVKQAEVQFVQMLWAGGASANFANVNLATGTVTAGTYTNATVTDAGNGWYRITITSTLSAGSAFAYLWLVNSGAAGRAAAYTGNGTNGVLAWGAQLELSPTATAYQRITDFTSDFLAAFPTHGLYQDAAGTTPVTALGQPVGLALDQSRGALANLGSELVSNGDFSNGTTGWTGFVANLAVSGGRLQVTPTDASSRSGYQVFSTVVGRMYRVSVQYDQGTTTGVLFRVRNDVPNGVIVFTSSTFTGTGTTQFIFTAGSTTSCLELATAASNSGNSGFFDNVTAREVPGVHAIQSTSASRPLLDGRVNLLTYSEQFDNAAWSKTAASVSANTSVAPDGTTTADTFTQDTTTNTHNVWRSSGLTGAGAYTYSTYLKASTAQFVTLSITDGSSSGSNQIYATFDTANGTVTKTGGAGYSASSVTSVGNGWYRCSVTGTIVTPVNTAVYVWTFQNTTGTPTYGGYGGESFTGTGASVLIWGADLRLAADAAYPYQRVAAATDYADVGVPRAFAFDGFDDSLYTASNMDLSGTDKVTVLAGVRKLSDAAEGTVCELSAAANGNNGAFAMRAPWDINANADYAFQSRGTSFVNAQSAAFRAADTAVLTGQGDIAGDVCTLRRNGTQIALDASDQGTGNYGSYVLFIGRRNNASLPFNGKAYQLIVRGALTDAATLAQAERYVGARTGISL